MKILCVDDDVTVQRLYKQGLSNIFLDDTIEVVGSGEEAVKVIDEQNVEIVITDLKMPGMSGLDVLKNVKEKSPATEVIIVTGMASIKTAVDAIRLGARDYIEKPISFEMLTEKINNIKEYRARVDEAEEFRLAKETFEQAAGRELHMLELKNQNLIQGVEIACEKIKKKGALSAEESEDVLNILLSALGRGK